MDLRDQKNFLEKQRQDNPIFQLSDNYFVACDYKSVKDLIRSSSLSRQMKQHKENDIHSLLDLDDEEHQKYRQLVSPFFANSSIQYIENSIRDQVHKVFHRIKDESKIDIVKKIAFPIPFYSICKILGVSIDEEDDYSFIADWTNSAMLVLNTNLTKEEYSRHIIGTEKVFTYLVNLLFDKNNKKDENGIFYYLKNTQIDGRKITNEEIISICIMLFIGGFETNLNTFTTLAYEIIKDAETAFSIKNNIDNKNTVEEMFRYSSSLNFITRRVNKNITTNTIDIPCDSYLILHIASANRDNKIFDNPHKIQVNRYNSSMHLSFGGGPHYCLGASLSRLQISAIVKEFLNYVNDKAFFSSEPELNASTSMNGYRRMELVRYY